MPAIEARRHIVPVLPTGRRPLLRTGLCHTVVQNSRKMGSDPFSRKLQNHHASGQPGVCLFARPRSAEQAGR
jgi:hypothetical protein